MLWQTHFLLGSVLTTFIIFGDPKYFQPLFAVKMSFFFLIKNSDYFQVSASYLIQRFSSCLGTA